jgi:hypothetical protein
MTRMTKTLQIVIRISSARMLRDDVVNVRCRHNLIAIFVNSKPITTYRIASLDPALGAPPTRIVTARTGTWAPINLLHPALPLMKRAWFQINAIWRSAWSSCARWHLTLTSPHLARNIGQGICANPRLLAGVERWIGCAAAKGKRAKHLRF